MQKLEKALSGWEGGLGRTGREVLQIVAPFIKSCILIWQIYRKLFFLMMSHMIFGLAPAFLRSLAEGRRLLAS